MKKRLVTVMVIGLCAGLMLSGCGAQKAASSKEAIDTAKTMETTKQKTDYLIGQAKAFYNSKDFQDAVDVAQYVLRYLDKESQEAQKLLDLAKKDLAATAQGALKDVKKRFGR